MRLNLADIATQQGNVAAAHSLIASALASWRDLGYQQGVGRALYMLAQLDEEHGHATTALPRYEESLAVWRPVHYRAGVAEAAASVGWLRLAQGDHAAGGHHVCGEFDHLARVGESERALPRPSRAVLRWPPVTAGQRSPFVWPARRGATRKHGNFAVKPGKIPGSFRG